MAGGSHGGGGGRRPAQGLAALLRGALSEDPSQRWGVPEQVAALRALFESASRGRIAPRPSTTAPLTPEQERKWEATMYYYRATWCREISKSDGDAAAMYERALDFDPERVVTLCNYGTLLKKKKNLVGAEAM